MEEQKEGLYGPIGFMRSPEILDLIRPFTKGINGYFNDLDVATVEKLLWLLPQRAQAVRENSAPTFAQFVALGLQNPGMVFGGYFIGSQVTDSAREDACVAITQCAAHHSEALEARLRSLAEGRRGQVWTEEQPGEGKVVCAWWD